MRLVYQLRPVVGLDPVPRWRRLTGGRLPRRTGCLPNAWLCVRLSGALWGSTRQAVSDGVDGDAFVCRVGAAGPVEPRHPCAACVVQADQSPFVVEDRTAGAAALGR